MVRAALHRLVTPFPVDLRGLRCAARLPSPSGDSQAQFPYWAAPPAPMAGRSLRALVIMQGACQVCFLFLIRQKCLMNQYFRLVQPLGHNACHSGQKVANWLYTAEPVVQKNQSGSIEPPLAK